MSNQPVRAATHPDPHGWRAATVRVLVNALLVLLAFEVVSMVAGAAGAVVTGTTFAPGTPVEAVLLLAVFLLVRWIVILPGLLPVLIGIEYVARRAPHARVLTTIVAFAPMVWWELTQPLGDFPSEEGAILGVTAVLFGVLARLPARFQERSTVGRAPTQTPAGTAVVPR